ncbi:hypothetical protein HDIA_3330 [Hartmannibacter diazotrophicus]|uniref:DUF2380 domain-containing protein n=1 Tax=Hartmannibacter diazotrophicus TaxID=1482074 RepID=A0A2C9DAV3_9HYPH|nr:DUF2380 domain-containing protein [Hartmannibacter diazotrophicus]SON56871.1 hypothetical protein HDIA_3330 [Hartmannibacter diazotrophicus]
MTGTFEFSASVAGARKGLAGLVGALVLAGALMTGSGQAARAETVAFMPIKFLDTSAEPKDQTADHDRRLRAMTESLHSYLASRPSTEVVAISRDELDATCANPTTDCILKMASDQKADYVFLASIQKTSTLITQMWVDIVDLEAKTIAFKRELNFRGDNDEAWRRASVFLEQQLAQWE